MINLYSLLNLDQNIILVDLVTSTKYYQVIIPNHLSIIGAWLTDDYNSNAR